MSDKVADLEMVKQGSQLEMAFKTEPGKVIADAFLSHMVDGIEKLLLDDIPEEELLKVLYELRGFTRVMGVTGDLMKFARTFAAKKIAKDSGMRRSED